MEVLWLIWAKLAWWTMADLIRGEEGNWIMGDFAILCTKKNPISFSYLYSNTAI
jgi:hypothetical protein